MTDDIPQSKKRRRRSWLSPVWLVPILAAALLGGFLHRKYAEEGPTIEIAFKHAEGLQAAKTDLRYRGVKIGEVRRLKLDDDLKRVIAEVALDKTAEPLANAGTKFWIVKPRVSPAGIEGLSTLISGAYIEAMPGKGPEKDRFEALDQPPPVEADQRGLEIYLTTDRQGSLQPDTPIFYKGVKVGAVASSELSPDARQVRSRAIIEKPYRALVRANSKFWNVGGVKVDFSLIHGLDVRAKSFGTLVEGGVAFATPDSPGPKAKDDQAFPLAEKADDAWLKWKPAIKLGEQPPEDER